MGRGDKPAFLIDTTQDPREKNSPCSVLSCKIQEQPVSRPVCLVLPGLLLRDSRKNAGEIEPPGSCR